MWAVALIVAATTHFTTATLSFGARCKVENTFKDARAAHAKKTLIQDLDDQICFTQSLPLEYILIRHLHHSSSNGAAACSNRRAANASASTASADVLAIAFDVGSFPRQQARQDSSLTQIE
jgi:hypothetical protein